MSSFFSINGDHSNLPKRAFLSSSLVEKTRTLVQSKIIKVGVFGFADCFYLKFENIAYRKLEKVDELKGT